MRTIYHSSASVVLPDQYGKFFVAMSVATGNFRFTVTVAVAVPAVFLGHLFPPCR